MKTLATALLMICVTSLPVSADDAGPPIGDAIKSVPIFDAHVHYKEPAWSPYPVETVIGLMDKSGVAMALVSSTPDDGTIMLWEHAPGRIVPELRPYHGAAGSSNWAQFPGMYDYLKQRLDKYPHEGIGEFHIHSIDPNDRPLLTQVAKLAVERQIIIHVHSGAAPVKLLYDLEPGLTIIWAHAGMSEPPSVVGPMLDSYPTLHADMSYREGDILRGNPIDPAWRALILKHADRLMVGTDTWVNGQWDNYQGLIAENREWLSHFPREVAEQIAFRNAERLFKRKISMDLIGTK